MADTAITEVPSVAIDTPGYEPALAVESSPASAIIGTFWPGYTTPSVI